MRSCDATLPFPCLAVRGEITSFVGPVCAAGQMAVPSLGPACFESVGWRPDANNNYCGFSDGDQRVGFVVYDADAVNCSVNHPELSEVVDIQPEHVWSRSKQVTAQLNPDVSTAPSFSGATYNQSGLCTYCQTEAPPHSTSNLKLQLFVNSAAADATPLLLTVTPQERLLGGAGCYTDASYTRPSRVNVILLTPGRYNVSISGDGYYWCYAYDALSGARTRSDRTLFRQKSGLPRLAVLVPPLQNDSHLTLTKEALANRFNVSSEAVRLKQELNSGLLFHVTGAADAGDWPSLDVLYVRDTDVCPRSANSSHVWPETNIGQEVEVISEGCTMARKCAGDFNVGGVWESPRSVSGCAALNTSAAVENLLNISMSPLEAAELDGVVAKFSEFLDHTSSVGDLSPGDSAQVLDAVDRILAQVDLDAANGSLQVVRPQLAVLVVAVDDSVRGFALSGGGSDLSDSSLTPLGPEAVGQDLARVDVAVRLERALSLPRDARIAFAVFADDSAFASSGRVGSRVLGVTLSANGTALGLPDGQHVDILFRPRGTAENLQCAFWNSTQSRWLKDGCRLVGTSPPGLLTCRCHHLTHFALILTDADALPGGAHAAAMDVVSLLGCVLSLVGLLGIALTAGLVPHWRRKLEHKVMLHMTAAVALNMVLFLVTSVGVHGVACSLLGALLHYSVLASQCWMLTSAATHYLRFATLGGPAAVPRFLLKASLLAWGAPLLPIGVLLAVNHDSYIDPKRGFCYPSGLAFYLAVLLPVALILVVNTVVFVLILHRVDVWPCCKKKSRLTRFGVSEKKIFIRKIITSIFLFFLFGLTWIFGVFAASIVAAYLFCIFATLQGFLLFIFFVLGERNARKYYGELVPKTFKGKFRKIRSGSGASLSTTSSTLLSGKLYTSKESKRLTPVKEEDNPMEEESLQNNKKNTCLPTAEQGAALLKRRDSILEHECDGDFTSSLQQSSSLDRIQREEITLIADVEPEFEPIIPRNPSTEQRNGSPVNDAEWVVKLLSNWSPSVTAGRRTRYTDAAALEDDNDFNEVSSLLSLEPVQYTFVNDGGRNDKISVDDNPSLNIEDDSQITFVANNELNNTTPTEDTLPMRTQADNDDTVSIPDDLDDEIAARPVMLPEEDTQDVSDSTEELRTVSPAPQEIPALTSEPRTGDHVDKRRMRKKNPFSNFVETILLAGGPQETTTSQLIPRSHEYGSSEAALVTSTESNPFNERSTPRLSLTAPDTLGTFQTNPFRHSSRALDEGALPDQKRSSTLSLNDEDCSVVQPTTNPFRSRSTSALFSDQLTANPFTRLVVSLVSLEDTYKPAGPSPYQGLAESSTSARKRRAQSASNPFIEADVSELANDTSRARHTEEWHVNV